MAQLALSFSGFEDRTAGALIDPFPEKSPYLRVFLSGRARAHGVCVIKDGAGVAEFRGAGEDVCIDLVCETASQFGAACAEVVGSATLPLTAIASAKTPVAIDLVDAAAAADSAEAPVVKGRVRVALTRGMPLMNAAAAPAPSYACLKDYIRASMDFYTGRRPLHPVLEQVHCPQYATRMYTGRAGDPILPGAAYVFARASVPSSPAYFEHTLRLALSQYGMARDTDMAKLPRATAAAIAMRACAQYAVAAPYISDHAIILKRVVDVERFGDIQITRGGDCEDLAKHIYMMADQLATHVTADGNVGVAARLIDEYVPLLCLGAVRSAALKAGSRFRAAAAPAPYMPPSEPAGFMAHIFTLLIPRTHFARAAGPALLPLRASASAQNDLPVLIGEGTGRLFERARNPGRAASQFATLVETDARFTPFNDVFARAAALPEDPSVPLPFYRYIVSAYTHRITADTNKPIADVAFTQGPGTFGVKFEDVVRGDGSQYTIEACGRFTSAQATAIRAVLDHDSPIEPLAPPPSPPPDEDRALIERLTRAIPRKVIADMPPTAVFFGRADLSPTATDAAARALSVAVDVSRARAVRVTVERAAAGGTPFVQIAVTD